MIGVPLAKAKQLYLDVVRDCDLETMRELCRTDLFFLLFVVCNRRDMDNEWVYERCNEVQSDPDGFLDLWAREHYKSTILTFGLNIQRILRNPENTIGIFSHTRPIAKGFLKQIKRELESNVMLKGLFPDILYSNPQKDSPQWSLDDGIMVRRLGNPKEATIEAWGLVDGQPTSKHYTVLHYDDVVTRESVSGPDMINKVTDAWALSLNLGARGGARSVIGTRYHYNDTYRIMIDRGSVKVRQYPATKNGKPEGEPVLLSRTNLAEKRRDMGPYVFGAQMLLDPVADAVMGFREEWLRRSDIQLQPGWNIYILVDPANDQKKKSDFTVMVVIALGPDGHYRLLDGIRDRLNLTQRAQALFRMVRKWRPIRVGYEQYGMQADIQHIKTEQERTNYLFEIQPLGGSMSKNDRIRRLVPIFEQGRFIIPHRLPFMTAERKINDFAVEFVTDEFLAFPVAPHDDMLDCIARILDEDLGAEFPLETDSVDGYLEMRNTSASVNSNYEVL